MDIEVAVVYASTGNTENMIFSAVAVEISSKMMDVEIQCGILHVFEQLNVSGYIYFFYKRRH